MKNLRSLALPGSLALVAALGLGGCSSEATAEDAAAPTETTEDEASAQGDGEDDSGVPAQDRGGVSGLVAAVSGTVAQVQDSESQTAVTWSDATVFRRTTTVTLDAVTVGSCVVAVLASEESDSAAATALTVSEAVDGECSGGFGGMGGAAPGERPDSSTDPGADGESGGLSSLDGASEPPAGDRPEISVGEPPSGEMPDGFGSVVAGRVTAVAGTTVTVEVVGTDGSTTTEVVETSGETVVTATVDADASAVAVGLCASVQGEADTSGGMAATAITVSDPGEDGCTSRGGIGMISGGPRPGEEAGDE